MSQRALVLGGAPRARHRSRPAVARASYVTVTPSLELRVSRRIREEFENGRDYYALAGRTVATPQPGFAPPRRELLDWHSDVVFRS